jgi:uncharacterized protein YegL
MRFPIFIFALLVLVLTADIRAAARAGSCAERLVPISLVAPDASFLPGFLLSDIAVKSRAPGVEVLSVGADRRARRVVIVLDVSGSMAGESSQRWKVVSQFVSYIASLHADNTQFALILFSDHLLETIDFTQDRGAVPRRLGEISKDAVFAKRNVRGKTALYDALETGFRLIPSPTSADSLFVITDGEDNVSKTSAKEILKMCSASMVRIFALLFARSAENRTLSEAQAAPEFLALVESAGGSAFGPVIVDEMGRAAIGNPYLRGRPVFGSLLEFYRSMLENPVLALRGTLASNSSTSLSIALSKEGRQHWKNAAVLYPHQIIACP